MIEMGEKLLNYLMMPRATFRSANMGVMQGLFLPLLLAGVVAAASGPISAKNVTLIGHLDIEGGGMVDVKGNLAAVGHMGPPYATTVLDVSDPTNPRILARIKARAGTHSHKARICGNTLVINVERYGGGGAPTHTALPVGHKILGKDWLIVFDEEMGGGDPPAFMRVFDITDEKRPIPAATLFVCPQTLPGRPAAASEPISPTNTWVVTT